MSYTITVVGDGIHFIETNFMEFTGAVFSGTDGSNSAFSTPGSTTPAAGSFTPGSSGDVIVAACSTEGTTTVAAAGSFTLGTDNTGLGHLDDEWFVQS